MKVFKFRYDPHPRKTAMEAMNNAIATGKRYVRDGEMLCGSMEEITKIMSKRRFDVFAAIAEHRPGSLYELAKILKKDQANILKEARTLEGLGLIKLVADKSKGRASLRPEALYNQINFELGPIKAKRAI